MSQRQSSRCDAAKQAMMKSVRAAWQRAMLQAAAEMPSSRLVAPPSSPCPPQIEVESRPCPRQIDPPQPRGISRRLPELKLIPVRGSQEEANDDNCAVEAEQGGCGEMSAPRRSGPSQLFASSPWPRLERVGDNEENEEFRWAYSLGYQEDWKPP